MAPLSSDVVQLIDDSATLDTAWALSVHELNEVGIDEVFTLDDFLKSRDDVSTKRWMKFLSDMRRIPGTAVGRISDCVFFRSDCAWTVSTAGLDNPRAVTPTHCHLLFQYHTLSALKRFIEPYKPTQEPIAATPKPEESFDPMRLLCNSRQCFPALGNTPEEQDKNHSIVLEEMTTAARHIVTASIVISNQPETARPLPKVLSTLAVAPSLSIFVSYYRVFRIRDGYVRINTNDTFNNCADIFTKSGLFTRPDELHYWLHNFSRIADSIPE